VATTPVFETLLVIDVLLACAEVVLPYPKIAKSTPYPTAANDCLAVPTPVVSLATTPELETKLVNET
jgi:energy-converting hydrogenase Eha subunit A